MVRLKLTTRLSDLCKLAITADDFEQWSKSPQGIPKSDIQSYIDSDAQWIPHDVVVRLHSKYHNGSLLNLLGGSDIYLPPKPIKKRSLELEKILNQIQKDLDQKEYNAMLNISNDNELDKVAWKEVQQYTSIFINIIFSTLAVATAVYWWSGNVTVETKVILSLIAAFVVAGAESGLYLIVTSKVHDKNHKVRT